MSGIAVVLVLLAFVLYTVGLFGFRRADNPFFLLAVCAGFICDGIATSLMGGTSASLKTFHGLTGFLGLGAMSVIVIASYLYVFFPRSLGRRVIERFWPYAYVLWLLSFFTGIVAGFRSVLSR